MEKDLKDNTEILNQSLEKLERLSVQTVSAIAKAIDAKDPYTKGHSQRVANYSQMIAQRLGKDSNTVHKIYYIAILHDVGKIGIPDAIINKDSALTECEYEIIKQHTVIGHNILSEINEMPDIAIGAQLHHERYDGTGYPLGLSGEEIPEIARIIAIADAYDTMTSNRIYRSILPQEKVLKEIEDGRGTQFDPIIADIMLDIIREDKDYKLHE